VKIAEVKAIPLEIPFSHGGNAAGWTGSAWTSLATTLVKVSTDTGLVGYGEAFSYNCQRPVQAAIEDMIAPIVVGREITELTEWMQDLQQKLHLFGRYGIAMFAISGLDIALWDIKAKAEGVSLCTLLGGPEKPTVSAYASLFRHGEPQTVADQCRAAVGEGYGWIKLHETEVSEVSAAREALGRAVPIMVDTNCPWLPDEAREKAAALKPYDLLWLEEPIFPPEDFSALAKLQVGVGIPIAAGENACTVFEFEKMFAAGAVTYAQPSVTKVGGITELLKVIDAAELAGVAVMPHSPYFGPGLLATLHVIAARAPNSLAERFYVQPEALLYDQWSHPEAGVFQVPTGPGLGVEPDVNVISDYGVGEV